MATLNITSMQNDIIRGVLAINDASILSKVKALLKTTEKNEKTLSYKEKVLEACGSWDSDTRSTEKIIDDIYSSRQSGVTRHIMPLSDEDWLENNK
jgi:hypothetical protein